MEVKAAMKVEVLVALAVGATILMQVGVGAMELEVVVA